MAQRKLVETPALDDSLSQPRSKDAPPSAPQVREARDAVLDDIRRENVDRSSSEQPRGLQNLQRTRYPLQYNAGTRPGSERYFFNPTFYVNWSGIKPNWAGVWYVDQTGVLHGPAGPRR